MGWFPRFDGDKIQLKRLMRQLEIDEGRSLKVYLDTKGLPTVGIGHLIKETDPPEIRSLKVGDSITKEQLQSLFEGDLAIAISDFNIIFPDRETLPAEVQEIIINMLFNMGRARLLKFKDLIAAVYVRDWAKAADEMVDSKWYRELEHLKSMRAKRLVSQMRSMA